MHSNSNSNSNGRGNGSARERIVDEYDVTTSTGGSADASAFLGQNRTAADRIAETVARRTVSSILEAF